MCPTTSSGGGPGSPSPPGAGVPPAGSLPRSLAFERLTRRIANLDESGWRLARFAPPPSLPLAEVHLPAAGRQVTGEVLDLSVGGIRLAIDHGIRVRPGDPCRLVVTLGSEAAEAHVLEGRVRRVQDHQMIMVFVVTPDDGPGGAGGHGE